MVILFHVVKSASCHAKIFYSMLLDKENIRVGIDIPEDAGFELVEADEPATASIYLIPKWLSLRSVSSN